MQKHFDPDPKTGQLPKAAQGYRDIDTNPSDCCGALVIYVEDAKVAKCTRCGKREGYKYGDSASNDEKSRTEYHVWRV